MRRRGDAAASRARSVRTASRRKEPLVSTLLAANPRRAGHGLQDASSPGFTLAAAVLGFFMITLDAVVVNVALPSIRAGLGGGLTGLQWVVDGYTLMFAALLLSAGSLSDRSGAARLQRRAGSVRP